jgi:hypothetical protein
VLSKITKYYFFILLLILLSSCKNQKIETKDSKSDIETVHPISFSSDTIKRKSNIDSIYATQILKEKNNLVSPPSVEEIYNSAYQKLEEMIEGKRPLNFKESVFITENAYFNDSLPHDLFDREIQLLIETTKKILNEASLNKYSKADSINVLMNFAIYKVLKDTIWLTRDIPARIPFQYDFNDFTGEDDLVNTFVIKLGAYLL